MLMALGMFTFELPTLAFQEFESKTGWRHGSSDRFGARPVSQYLGPDADTVTLSGVLLPGVSGSLSAMAALKEMGDQGEAWPLVDGTGKVHGTFVLNTISERGSNFMDGGVPRRTDFTIELGRIGDG